MANYFVDPTNGSNSNDGLTPNTAYADIFTGVGEENNIPTFWIKRGETIPISTEKTINFGQVNAWPKSTDAWFADRPQEGIDAGWDSDITPSPIISLVATEQITYMNIDQVDTADLNFNGIYFDMQDTFSSTLFKLKSAKMTFKHCDFIGDGFKVLMFVYIAAVSVKELENGVVELIDCNINNKDWSTTGSRLYYNYANDDTNYKKDMYLNRTTINGLTELLYSRKNGHGRHMRIFIDDCQISVIESLARVSNHYSSSYQYQYYTITNSTIRANKSIFEIAYTTTYASRHFAFESIGSTFLAGEYIIDDHHTDANSTIYSILTDVTLRDSVFQAQRFYRNHGYDKTRIENLDIRDCTFKNMDTVFRFEGLSSTVTSFNFVNNVLDEVDSLIYCNPSYTQKCAFNIYLKGQSITSFLINRCDGGEIYVEDCNIGKELTGNDTDNVSIVAINSNFDAIQGNNHTVALSSCRIESNNGPALQHIHGEIHDSQIISPFVDILTQDSTVVFDGCNLSVQGVTIPKKNLKFIKTVYNGTPTPLKVVNTRSTREISPIYRVTGNPFSLFVQVLPLACVSRSIINEVYTTHIIAKPIITMYMTSVNDLTDTESITVKASFVSEGILKVVNMAVVLDPSSQWDGVQVENIKYKAIADLSAFTITEGSKIKVMVSMSHESGKTSSINIDTLLGQA
jgi:hypothetical protein